MLIALSAASTPLSSIVGSGWTWGEQAVLYTGLLGEAGCLDVAILQCVDTVYAVCASHTNYILQYGIKLSFPGSNASRRDVEIIDVGNGLAGTLKKLLCIWKGGDGCWHGHIWRLSFFIIPPTPSTAPLAWPVRKKCQLTWTPLCCSRLMMQRNMYFCLKCCDTPTLKISTICQGWWLWSVGHQLCPQQTWWLHTCHGSSCQMSHHRSGSPHLSKLPQGRVPRVLVGTLNYFLLQRGGGDIHAEVDLKGNIDFEVLSREDTTKAYHCYSPRQWHTEAWWQSSCTWKQPQKLTIGFYMNLTRKSSLGKPPLKLTHWTQTMAPYNLVLSSYTGKPPLKLASLI